MRRQKKSEDEKDCIKLREIEENCGENLKSRGEKANWENWKWGKMDKNWEKLYKV